MLPIADPVMVTNRFNCLGCCLFISYLGEIMTAQELMVIIYT